jgi:hypothetical protein
MCSKCELRCGECDPLNPRECSKCLDDYPLVNGKCKDSCEPG